MKCFTTPELMRWQQVCAIYEKELKQGTTENPPTDVFTETEQGKQRWEDLRVRVVEHVSCNNMFSVYVSNYRQAFYTVCSL